MDRYQYDLSHQSHMVGQIGRIQTHSVIPVVAGDSISIQWHGAIRLAPLVRYMTSDAKVDIVASYVPHRHSYGQQWIDFIQQGYDESITFPTIGSSNNVACYGQPIFAASELPYWLVSGYNRIRNRYFRNPTDDASIVADDYVSSGDNDRFYGLLGTRLKHLWTTGADDDITAATREVAVSGGVFDVIDLAQTRRQLRTEIDRQWFGQYYNDTLDNVFGGSASVDADERPTLLARKTMWLSGYDIDGTGDAVLGSFTGKSINACSMSVPRKFCPEHGAIYIQSLVRFPIVSQHEAHYLAQQTQPNYLDISGDQELWQAEPPRNFTTPDFFNQGNPTSLGLIPYGQHYRTQPSVIHTDFTQQAGFAFLDVVPSSVDEARYCQDMEYDNVFQTNQFGHWQHHAAVAVQKSTVVPGPKSSMFAGVNDV